MRPLIGISTLLISLILPATLGAQEPPTLKNMECKDAPACVNLGLERYKASDFGKASRYFTAACDAKQPQGCENLGVMAYKGQGQKKDVPRALNFFAQACEYGQVSSCKNAGAEFFAGKITPVDYARALTLFERGCALSDAYSCYHAGVLRVDPAMKSHDAKLGVVHLKKACDGKHAMACDALARVMFNGQGGAKKDPAGGVDYFDRACGMGVARSCQTGGLLLMEGKAVKKDEARAKKLLAAGCKLGDTKSCDASKEGASSPAKGKFNLTVNSMTVDGLSARDLRCNLARGGFMASAAIVGGLSKQKSAMDRCAGKSSYSPKISMTFAGSSTSDVRVEGVPKKVAKCVAKSVSRVKANVNGTCEVVVDIGE